jgi:hypothetical protein
MNEFLGTKGKWIYNNQLQMHSGYRVIYSINNVLIHKSENKNGLSENEIEANALLIAEAGNIRQQIPFSLTELKRQRDEMLEMLEKIYDYYSDNERITGSLRSFVIEIKQLIKESTQI